jgi:pyridoxamine 5'-phosphate oxidase family protein
MPVKFTAEEGAYIKSQPLARIGTASKNGEPDTAPVGFTFDGEYFYVGGRDLEHTNKFRNVRENPKVSLVIDDMASLNPWHPRGVKIRGTADLVDFTGYMGPAKYIRVKPVLKRSWGIGKPNQ